jgi:hypothetical protein
VEWDTGHHDLTPWYQYSLGVLIYAYREFEARVSELVAAPGAKSQMVRSAIDTFVSGHTFSISELERLCPTVSRETVRRVLRGLREKGQVECLGTGRSGVHSGGRSERGHDLVNEVKNEVITPPSTPPRPVTLSPRPPISPPPLTPRNSQFAIHNILRSRLTEICIG